MAPVKSPYPITEAWPPTSFDAKLALCASPMAKKLKMVKSPNVAPNPVTAWPPTSFDEKLALCASPMAKKLKMHSLHSLHSLHSPHSPHSPMSLSGYLDYGTELDALVPSASDLVTAETAWLLRPPTSPGSACSPAHVPSCDDGEDDDGTALLGYPSDPGSGSLFGEDAEELERAFDAALLDAGHDESMGVVQFGEVDEDQIVLAVDTVTETNHIFHGNAVPAPPPPSRESTPSPDLFGAAVGMHENTVTQGTLAPVAPPAFPIKKGKPAKTSAPKAKGMKKAVRAAKLSTKSAAAVVKAAAVAQSAAMAADGVDSSDKARSDRWIHNTTERKRRGEVRKLFGDLRDLFPDLAGDERTANITTLTHAVAHIAEMHRLDEIQAHELKMIRDRNVFLKAQAARRQQFESEQQPAAHLLSGGLKMGSSAWDELQQQLLEQQRIDAARIVARTPMPPIRTAAGPCSPVKAFEKGTLPLTAPPTLCQLRAALPPALRGLLDHNGRGTAEVLPPRRRRASVIV